MIRKLARLSICDDDLLLTSVRHVLAHQQSPLGKIV